MCFNSVDNDVDDDLHGGESNSMAGELLFVGTANTERRTQQHRERPSSLQSSAGRPTGEKDTRLKQSASMQLASIHDYYPPLQQSLPDQSSGIPDPRTRRLFLLLAAQAALQRAVLFAQHPRLLDLELVYQPQIAVLSLYLEHLREAKSRRQARERHLAECIKQHDQQFAMSCPPN